MTVREPPFAWSLCATAGYDLLRADVTRYTS